MTMTLQELNEILRSAGATSFHNQSKRARVVTINGYGEKQVFESALLSQLTGMVFSMNVKEIEIYDPYTDEDFEREFPSHAQHLKTWKPNVRIVATGDKDGITVVDQEWLDVQLADMDDTLADFIAGTGRI